LADDLTENLKQNVEALRTKTDTFEVHGRETYWQQEGKERAVFYHSSEKILGPAFTVRGTNTIRRIVAKYCSSKIC
jgi:hypothetical protein